MIGAFFFAGCRAASGVRILATLKPLDNYSPTALDLVLSVLAALAMPVACSILYPFVGAFGSLILYYGLFCFFIVKCRRGRLGYELEKGSILQQFRGYVSRTFLLVMGAQLILVLNSYFILERVTPIDPIGFLLTLALWAPINAFAEQLIWMYVFDSYADFYKEGPRRTILIVIGILLYVALIGLIHALFWSQFLLESAPISPFSQIFFALQFVVSFGYIFLYRESESMWPLGIIHLILNVTGIIFSGYSILPYLFPPV